MPLEDEPIWSPAQSAAREGGCKATCLGKELPKEKSFLRYYQVAVDITTTGSPE